MPEHLQSPADRLLLEFCLKLLLVITGARSTVPEPYIPGALDKSFGIESAIPTRFDLGNSGNDCRLDVSTGISPPLIQFSPEDLVPYSGNDLFIETYISFPISLPYRQIRKAFPSVSTYQQPDDQISAILLESFQLTRHPVHRGPAFLNALSPSMLFASLGRKERAAYFHEFSEFLSDLPARDLYYGMNLRYQSDFKIVVSIRTTAVGGILDFTSSNLEVGSQQFPSLKLPSGSISLYARYLTSPHILLSRLDSLCIPLPSSDPVLPPSFPIISLSKWPLDSSQHPLPTASSRFRLPFMTTHSPLTTPTLSPSGINVAPARDDAFLYSAPYGSGGLTSETCASPVVFPSNHFIRPSPIHDSSLSSSFDFRQEYISSNLTSLIFDIRRSSDAPPGERPTSTRSSMISSLRIPSRRRTSTYYFSSSDGPPLSETPELAPYGEGYFQQPIGSTSSTSTGFDTNPRTGIIADDLGCLMSESDMIGRTSAATGAARPTSTRRSISSSLRVHHRRRSSPYYFSSHCNNRASTVSQTIPASAESDETASTATFFTAESNFQQPVYTSSTASPPNDVHTTPIVSGGGSTNTPSQPPAAITNIFNIIFHGDSYYGSIDRSNVGGRANTNAMHLNLDALASVVSRCQS